MKNPPFGITIYPKYPDLMMITFPSTEYLFGTKMITTMKVTTDWTIKSGTHESSYKPLRGYRLSINSIDVDLSRCSLTHDQLADLSLCGTLPPDSAWVAQKKEKK